MVRLECFVNKESHKKNFVRTDFFLLKFIYPSLQQLSVHIISSNE